MRDVSAAPHAPHRKYRFGARIGGGGMAEVFRGTVVGAEGFERPVAIKRMLPSVSEDPEFAAMFVNEARISSCCGTRTSCRCSTSIATRTDGCSW